MAGDLDSGMYEAYWDLRKEVQEVIEAVEAGDINFEIAIERLKEASDF